MEAKYHRNTDNTGTVDTGRKEEKQENPLGFKEMLEKYVLIHWKWYVLSVSIALLIGLVYVRSQPETFSVNTKLLIRGQYDMAGTELALLRGAAPGRLSFYRLTTESELIKSQALMERVVYNLDLYTTYTSSRFLRQKDLYDYTPFEVHIDSVSLYRLQSSMSIVITPEDDNTHTVVIDGSTRTINKFPYHVKVPQGVISIYRKERVPLSNKPIYVTITNPVKMAKQISNSIYTSTGEQVDIMHASITTGHPKKGGDILRAVIDLYNKDAIDDINRSALNTIYFIDERMVNINQELFDVEIEAEKYKQAHKITDVPSAAQRYLTRDVSFEMRDVDADMQLSMIQFVEKFIDNPTNDFELIPDLGLTDPSLSARVRGYNDLITKRDRLSSSSSAANPIIKSIIEQLEISREAIREGISNNRRAIEVSKSDIGDQAAFSKAKLYEIPRQQREYLGIQRQLQIKEQLFMFMMQKREEASLTMAIAVDKAKILTPPDNAVLTGPQTKITLLIAMLIGLVLPLAIIFLLDWIDNTIKSPADIERLCKIPILSELGHNTSSEIILDHDDIKSSDSELFRLLRTRLQFVMNNGTENEKVILVTSTVPSEGKSYVSANLGISLSKIGKKIILLGMDLRKPQIAKQFKLTKKEGISSYLSGMETNINNLIDTSEDYPNLSFIAAGIIPPNPNELLMSENLDKMIDYLRKEYDYIVIDSAPLGAVSDTLLINRVTDIVLYVCRMKYSDISNMIFINRLYDDNALKNPYLLLNDMKLESKYYYHRGYGYGYNYGYNYNYGYGYGRTYGSYSANNRSRRSWFKNRIK